jgi:hypothetical protein
MTTDVMSIDEVLIHLSMGEACKGGGSPYVVSYQRYKRIEAAMKHYVESGDLVKNEYGAWVKKEAE